MMHEKYCVGRVNISHLQWELL